MQRLYRWQAPLFDLTRGPVLRRRDAILRYVAPGDTVLEVGCGTGRNLPGLHRRVGRTGRVVGVECAPAMAARARRRIRPGIDVLELEYGPTTAVNGPFDAVIFSYSLSMIPDYRAALLRARDDLRDGGRLIVLDFASTRFGLVRRWMRGFGVALGADRTACITELLHVRESVEWRAYGLWDYRLVVAEKLG